MNHGKEFKTLDENGNSWRLSLEQHEKYPTRYDLKFYFNEKAFKLQQFGSARDAGNMWELLEVISKQKKGEQ